MTKDMSLGDIQPISLLRPSEVVAAELRQRILRGEWREGVPLPAASVLAQRLGISRHHLREALRLLEHDGLIRIERGPTGGVSVAIPDEETVTRILEGILARHGTPMTEMNVARAAIDSSVVALATEQATEEDIADLEAIIEKQQAEGYWQATCTRFHPAIARAAHNLPLVVIAGATWPIGTHTAEDSDELVAVRKSPALGRHALQAHRDILQAIKDRDSTRAITLMRRHHATMSTHYASVLDGVKIGAKYNWQPSDLPASDLDLERDVPGDLTCDICGREGFKSVGGRNRHKTRIHGKEK